QEVDDKTLRSKGKDLAAIAAETCEMAHIFGTSQRLMGGAYGNAILVRGIIESTSVTRLPKVPASRFWQEQRTVLEAEVTVDGRPLWVACTHLAVKRWNNEPQLEFLLEHLNGRPRPLVLMGDFNRPSDAVGPPAADAGLTMAKSGPTYPAGAPNRTIDHVLMSSGITVTAVEVRSTSMSDHAALVVDLELPAG
ncbi:MAG: endonuclease, partial [Acidimicrobiales bacterium]|nr:endonuclease [Acidimicrobiales bacterium]